VQEWRLLQRLQLTDLELRHLENRVGAASEPAAKLALARQLADLYADELLRHAADASRSASIRQRIDALWEADVGPELLAMTPEEAAEAVRDYIAKGVDFVKVAVSGHGIGPVEPLIFSPAVLRAMRDEVRKAGIPFQTHSFSVESLRLSIELEPELLQHPNVMSVPWHRASEAQQAAIDRMIAEIERRGTYAALMAIPHREQMRLTAAAVGTAET